jgi:hypothetical protein
MARTTIGVLSVIWMSLLLAPETPAQVVLKNRLSALLPPDAKIIETASLSVRGGKARTLVLWMSNPKRVVASWDSAADLVYGDHWFGPTSLSLIDPTHRKLINTIRVHSPNEAPDDNGSYSVPFFASDGAYYVPHTDKDDKGRPLLLHLRDLTGEGIAGQFALFDYVASGISKGSVFGYSPTSDRAVQYPIELKEGKFAPLIQSSATQVFATKPIVPGYWKFTWEAGHGSWAWIDETVRFDMKRQLFAEKQTIRPYPGFGEVHCDIEIKSLPDLLTAIGRVVPDFDQTKMSGVRGLIDTTRAGNLSATGVVVRFQGEQFPLQIEWLTSDARRISIEFTAASDLVTAIQIQGSTWCNAELNRADREPSIRCAQEFPDALTPITGGGRSSCLACEACCAIRNRNPCLRCPNRSAGLRCWIQISFRRGFRWARAETTSVPSTARPSCSKSMPNP